MTQPLAPPQRRRLRPPLRVAGSTASRASRSKPHCNHGLCWELTIANYLEFAPPAPPQPSTRLPSSFFQPSRISPAPYLPPRVLRVSSFVALRRAIYKVRWHAMASSSSRHGSARRQPSADQLAAFHAVLDKKLTAGVLCCHARNAELSATAATQAEAMFGDNSLGGKPAYE